MKILFLNPHLYEAPVLGTLRQLGVATIVCGDLRECELVFKLHSTSISLFVGHDQDGVLMNEIIKKNPRFARTPVILTTSHWGDQECIEHQATPFGANAYLRMPMDEKEFIHVVDQILSTELSHGKGFGYSDDLSSLAPMPSPPTPTGGLALAADPVLNLEEDRTEISMISGFTSAAVPVPVPVAVAVAVAETPAPVGNPLGIQIEDAASVYAQTSNIEEPKDGDAPNFEFFLESPNSDAAELGTGPEFSEPAPFTLVEKAETKEFRIDSMGDDRTSVSEIIARPIEAISDISDDHAEQATRVAIPDFASEPEPYLSPRTGAKPTLAASDEVDEETLVHMPYLGKSEFLNPLAYREPMDDSVVPGGAATAPDTETLKKYLYLREQDVTALSSQLRQAREQVTSLEQQLKHEKSVTTEFAHLAQEQDRRISGFDKEKSVGLEAAQKEIDDLKFEMKRRSEKIRVMELQVKEAMDATERLKERVRTDIRKIRTREKELENRLEIMKKDSEALLGSREQKIIELKRKLDLMEFNTDLLQELLERERTMTLGLRDKLAKAAQMMRVAGGILGPDEDALLASVA